MELWKDRFEFPVSCLASDADRIEARLKHRGRSPVELAFAQRREAGDKSAGNRWGWSWLCSFDPGEGVGFFRRRDDWAEGSGRCVMQASDEVGDGA
jgi:hypothetical protein